MATPLERTEDQIEKVKRKLLALGPMRPGSITRQYRQPRERKGLFYQMNYTHRMRSHSEYVRPEHLATLRQETATFKRFRKLIHRWVHLALVASQMRVRQATEPARHPR